MKLKSCLERFSGSEWLEALSSVVGTRLYPSSTEQALELHSDLALQGWGDGSVGLLYKLGSLSSDP